MLHDRRSMLTPKCQVSCQVKRLYHKHSVTHGRPRLSARWEVTFRTRQHFRGPQCLRTNGDDTVDDWRVFVDGGLDSAVVVVDGQDIGSAMLLNL